MSHQVLPVQFLFYLLHLGTIKAVVDVQYFPFFLCSSAKNTDTVVSPRLLCHYYPKTPPQPVLRLVALSGVAFSRSLFLSTALIPHFSLRPFPLLHTLDHPEFPH